MLFGFLMALFKGGTAIANGVKESVDADKAQKRAKERGEDTYWANGVMHKTDTGRPYDYTNKNGHVYEVNPYNGYVVRDVTAEKFAEAEKENIRQAEERGDGYVRVYKWEWNSRDKLRGMPYSPYPNPYAKFGDPDVWGSRYVKIDDPEQRLLVKRKCGNFVWYMDIETRLYVDVDRTMGAFKWDIPKDRELYWSWITDKGFYYKSPITEEALQKEKEYINSVQKRCTLSNEHNKAMVVEVN